MARQLVVSPGIDGRSQMTMQYAVGMGLNVAVVNIDDAKLTLARRLGATITATTKSTAPVAASRRQIGGAYGLVLIAVSVAAFEQPLGFVRRGGTVPLTGGLPGDLPPPMFEVVLVGITVRGSIVGTRPDLQEPLELAEAGKVNATVAKEQLKTAGHVFARTPGVGSKDVSFLLSMRDRNGWLARFAG